MGAEHAAEAAQGVLDFRPGVNAQTLLVNLPTDGEGFAITGILFAIAPVFLDRPPGAGGAGPVEVGQEIIGAGEATQTAGADDAHPGVGLAIGIRIAAHSGSVESVGPRVRHPPSVWVGGLGRLSTGHQNQCE